MTSHGSSKRGRRHEVIKVESDSNESGSEEEISDNGRGFADSTHGRHK